MIIIAIFTIASFTIVIFTVARSRIGPSGGAVSRSPGMQNKRLQVKHFKTNRPGWVSAYDWENPNIKKFWIYFPDQRNGNRPGTEYRWKSAFVPASFDDADTLFPLGQGAVTDAQCSLLASAA